MADDFLDARIGTGDAPHAVGEDEADRRCVDHRTQPGFAGAQLRFRPDAIGHVVAADEDAVNALLLVEHRLVQQVDIAVAACPLEMNRHGARGVGLSGGVHAVEQLEEALLLELGKDFAHAAADELLLARDLDVGVVDVVVDVLRAGEQRHEARHLLEHQPLALRGSAPTAFTEHDVGRLAAHAEQCDDVLCVVANGRVREGEVRFGRLARAIEHEFDVVHVDRHAREHLIEQRRERGTGLCPDFEERLAECPRVPIGEQRNVAIVVDQGALIAPCHEHRLFGGQHHADERLQRWRPVERRTQGGRLPTECANERAGFSTAIQEGQHRSRPQASGPPLKPIRISLAGGPVRPGRSQRWSNRSATAFLVSSAPSSQNKQEETTAC